MISRINLCSWILITRLDIKGKLGNRVSKKSNDGGSDITKLKETADALSIIL